MLTECGKVLKIKRIQIDETAKAMAENIGISQSYLSQIENGKRSMPLGLSKKFCAAYKFTDEEIRILLKAEASLKKRPIKVSISSKCPPLKAEAARLFVEKLNEIDDKQTRKIIGYFKNLK